MAMMTPAPGALDVDAAHTAMLSLDVQAGIVSVYVKDESFVPRAARTLHAARTAGISVVHVKVGFRPLVPEANPRNMFLSAIKASPPHQQFFQGASGALHLRRTCARLCHFMKPITLLEVRGRDRSATRGAREWPSRST